MKKSKITIDEMHEYLAYWCSNDTVDDYLIAHERGFTEICIYLMQSSGALFELNETEKAILNYKVSDKKFRKLCDECFKDCLIFTNPETNETYWKPTDGTLDYFTRDKEIMSWGYTEKHKWGE